MNTDIIPGQRLFNALNGRELAELVIAQVTAEVMANYRMKQHLTYPRVKFNWSLTVEAYPLDPPEFTLSTTGEHVAKDGDEKDALSYVPPPNAKPEVVNLSGGQDETANVRTGEDITPPDKIRTDSQLPVSRIADGPKGTLVEKPVLSPPIARSTEIRKGSPVKQDKGD